MRIVIRNWTGLAAFIVLVFGVATQAQASELAGHWSCPAQLQLVSLGQSQLNLDLNTRSRLYPDGRYESTGDAMVSFGVWPLKLAATSRGQWWREGQQVTVEVEALELAPGSASGVEIQRLLIQQLTALFPDLPHTEVTEIVAESPGQLMLKDESGRQYLCTRL